MDKIAEADRPGATSPGWTAARGIRQRQKAARRLAPLACGCTDTVGEHHRHCRATAPNPASDYWAEIGADLTVAQLVAAGRAAATA